MSKHEYSDDELIRRVWDVEEIKKLVYKRGIYIANEWREKELDELWVRGGDARRTACFGRNTGWYVGMEAIRGYYVDKHLADRRAQFAAIAAADPSLADAPGNLYMGCLSSHPASTGLVELAGDGNTAKGMFYSIAQETTALPSGTAQALWMPEKLAFDFLREDGAWKIWHLVIANDLTGEAGEDYSKGSPYIDYATDPVALEFGTPTIPRIIHDATFNWWDNYPPMPEPYETFTDDISYGPEGWKAPVPPALGPGEGRNYA